LDTKAGDLHFLWAREFRALNVNAEDTALTSDAHPKKIRRLGRASSQFKNYSQN
jgi:hypothetical protein